MLEASLDEYLRRLELRLLRCTFFGGDAPPLPPPTEPQLPLPPPQQHPDSLLPSLEAVVTSIERGDYTGALSSDAVRRVFPFAGSCEFVDSVECAERFYSEVERSVEAFLGNDSEEDAWLQVLDVECGDSEKAGDDKSCRSALLMCVGIAALMAFLQRNMTGPIVDFSAFPLTFPQSEAGIELERGGKWDIWSRNQLTSSGSDMFGKFSMLQYIVYAKILLSKTKDLTQIGKDSYLSGTRSVAWWLFRVILLQQRILDELSSSLYDLLKVYSSETLHHFGDVETVNRYWGSILSGGEASVIVSMAHLEAGIMENAFGRVDSARGQFNISEGTSGLHLSVTGALGFRTVHQVDAKAQLVLITNLDSQKGDGRRERKCLEVQREGHDNENSSDLSSYKEEIDCDILMTPRLVENGINRVVDGNNFGNAASDNGPLMPIQQAIILAQCLHINKTNPDDELSRWKVAPFIEAIDAQEESPFIIRCFCEILRIRWESTRSHTKQRALVMMDKLVERIHEAVPGALQRIPFYYGVYMPSIPALRKEYGELLVSIGMIGEALKIFEDIELWDNLIYCYCLLGKKAAAVDLIKARLAEVPNDPKLWCSLGDVTSTDTYYEKALEVSCNRSARAKRSLARSAYSRGDYEKSKLLWESAMALNSLYPDGWFALGAAALKARDIDKALDAFIHAVQLDPDNGEAWNNVACLHMVRKKNKESFIAFKEALKFRRNSWQLWQNYSHVAFEIGNFNQALEGTKKVLDLSENKQIDTELMEKLVMEVERRTLMSMPASSQTLTFKSSTSCADKSNDLGTGKEWSGETELLVEMLGKALQQIVRSGGVDGSIWSLYARWHRIKGDLNMCSEALLRAVRSYQGSELWQDQDRFKKFARSSLELCSVYMEISCSTGSHRELSSAEMHLRNTIKQAAVNFSETEEFRLLQICLDEVRKCSQELSGRS